MTNPKAATQPYLRFHRRLRELMRTVSPYDNAHHPTQEDLANAIGISRSVLNKRLTGAGGNCLHEGDVHAIVRILAEWGAITTRAEAQELLQMAGCSPFTSAQWASPPLDVLTASAYTIQHQPDSGRFNVGRVDELALLDSALGEYPVVAITGVAGVGKSTLVAMYVAQDGYVINFWRNLHHNPRFVDFAQALLVTLGMTFDPQLIPRTADQANHLISVLRAPTCPTCLIVLNNFESVICRGQIQLGWVEFLELAVAGGLGTSRLVITSREQPHTRQGQEPHRLALAGLNADDGLELLCRLKVISKRMALLRLTTRVGGHPLALVFLSDLLKNHGYQMISSVVETTLKEVIAERLLDQVYQQLEPQEQQTLQFFSLFDAPTSVAVVAGTIAYLDAPLKRLDEEALRRLAMNLASSSLLDEVGDVYQMHPLVRDYVRSQLTNARMSHHAAAHYFQSCYHENSPESPPQAADLTPLLNAFEHLCLACDYRSAYTLLEVNALMRMSNGEAVTLARLLRRYGEYGRLFDMEERLASIPLEELGRSAWGDVRYGLGITCRLLGYMEQALRCSEQALTVAYEEGDHRAQGRRLGLLASCYSDIGEYERASRCHEQALAIAEKHSDFQAQANHLGSLGIDYAMQGEQERAIGYFERALEITTRLGDSTGNCGYLGNLGLAHSELGRYVQALYYYRQALEGALETGYQVGQADGWEEVGDAYQHLGCTLEALSCYLKAVPIFEHIGNLAYTDEIRGKVKGMQKEIGEDSWVALFANAEQLAADPHWLPEIPEGTQDYIDDRARHCL